MYKVGAIIQLRVVYFNDETSIIIFMHNDNYGTIPFMYATEKTGPTVNTTIRVAGNILFINHKLSLT